VFCGPRSATKEDIAAAVGLPDDDGRFVVPRFGFLKRIFTSAIRHNVLYEAWVQEGLIATTPGTSDFDLSGGAQRAHERVEIVEVDRWARSTRHSRRTIHGCRSARASRAWPGRRRNCLPS
jgi:hypothetical protein